ncbi:AAA family ATPase [Nitrobacter sp.]|uniref:AAA family ATPase n=1 Tax=Nitrobacter sp. TaxID=29420 RepID=UPI0025D8FC59|nr:AAA family ATPase [Nitrobacter sp.]
MTEIDKRHPAIIVANEKGGVGKSTLAPIVDAWQGAGHRVIGTATAWRVARALRQDLNIEAPGHRVVGRTTQERRALS